VCVSGSRPSFAQVPQSVELVCQVADDCARPVSGENVGFFTSSGASILRTTTPSGVCPRVTLAAGDTVSIVLEETSTSSGVTLGQLFERQMPSATADDFQLRHLVVFQPIAIPATLTTSAMTTSGLHGRWTFAPTDRARANGVNLNIAANVGLLLTNHEIQAYAAYHGLDLGSSSSTARLGLVIRSSSAELGFANLGVSLDCRGHGFTTPPRIRCIVAVSGVGSSTPPTLRAHLGEWKDEQADILLEGRLERGDNVLLIEQSASALPTQRLQKALVGLPPAILPTTETPTGPACPDNGHGTASIDMPPCPSVGNAACDPPVPESMDNCPTPASVGSVSCETWSISSSRHCGSGGSMSLTVSAGVSGSVSTGFSVGLGTGPASAQFEAGATGTVSASTSSSAEADVGLPNPDGTPGCAACNNGVALCGQCVRLCMQWATCTQSFSRISDAYDYDVVVSSPPEGGTMSGPSCKRRRIPCGRTTTVASACWVFVGTVAAICQRSCP
jgi:hypothetical protein